MSNTDHLFKKKDCYINGELKKGKVLAVSTYPTYRKVCFLVEGEKFGVFIEEKDFLGDTKFSFKNKKSNRNLSVATKQLITNLKGSIKVVNFIRSVVDELWNRYWKDRIVYSLINKDFEISYSYEIVTKLKQDYPHQSNYEVAQKLIVEKAIFATLTGLLKEIPGIKTLTSIPVVNQKVSFLNVKDLIVEVIHQIAFVYGYQEVTESERLAIFALVFNEAVLLKLNLKSLIESEVPIWEINVISNVCLFTIIGYATREFYETQTKLKDSPLNSEKEFMLIESKIKKESEKVNSQENRNKIEKEISKAENSDKNLVLT